MTLSCSLVLDAHAEDMDEIRQLTSEIGAFKPSRTRSRKSKDSVASRAQTKDSVSSISSVVDPAP